MKTLRYVVLIGVAALITTPGLQAQMELDFTPFVGATFFLADPPAQFAVGDRVLDDSEFSRSFTVGLHAGIRMSERWAVEGMFSWLPTTLSARRGITREMDVNGFMYGVTGLYYLPLNEIVQPFIGLGVGGETFDYQLQGADAHNEWMANVALGLYLKTSDSAGIRLEARDCIARFKSGVSGVDDTWENDLMMTVGLSFRTPIG